MRSPQGKRAPPLVEIKSLVVSPSDARKMTGNVVDDRLDRMRRSKLVLVDVRDCRSASKTDPPSARDSAKPSGATLRCAPPGLALRRRNLDGGQLFDADPGQLFGAV